MKIPREEWEALNARVAKLELELSEAKRGILMRARTGPIQLNVVVPMILDHMKVEVQHGYSWLQPIAERPVPQHSAGTKP